MATFKKTLSGDSRYKVELTVTEEEPTSADIASNSSRVTYSLDLTKSSGSGYYTSNKNNPIKVVINGETVVNKNISYDFRNHSSINVASGTKPIQHESDGTKTIACSGYFKDSNNSLGSATASGNLKLTDLHTPPSTRISGSSELQTALSSFVSSPSNKVVDNISVKQVTLTPTLYDEAQVSSYNVSSGEVSVTSSTSPLYMNFINKIGNITYQIITTDDMGGVGTDTSTWTTRIPYTKPTIVASNFTAKRQGQLTGNVRLVANGTYYLNQGALTQNITPTIKYSVKEKGTSTYILRDQTATITTNNGNWSMDFVINSIFNSSKSYEVELVATDNLIEAVNSNLPSISGSQVSPVTKATATAIVPIGEPTWTEYKDRVDFKKLTIDKKQILAPYTLYDGNESRTDKNITLNDSASNYKILEIYFNYYNPDDAKYKSIKVYEPNGKIALIDGSFANATYLYFESARYTINGTTLTRSSAYRWRFRIDGNATRKDTTTDDPSIWITRVVGYK